MPHLHTRAFHATREPLTRFTQPRSTRLDFNAHLGAHFACTPEPAEEALRTHHLPQADPTTNSRIILADVRGECLDVTSESQLAALALHAAQLHDWWTLPTCAPPAHLNAYRPHFTGAQPRTRTLDYVQVHRLLRDHGPAGPDRLTPHWALHVLDAQLHLLPRPVFFRAITRLAGHLRTHLLAQGIHLIRYPNDIEGGTGLIALTPDAILDPFTGQPWHDTWAAPLETA